MQRCKTAGAGLLMAAALLGVHATAASAYSPSDQTLAGKTITLTGKAMTVDQVVQIARHGAKVQLSASARQRSRAAYDLLLQGATENIPIYWFNRGAGSNRETVIFEGDPNTPANRKLLEESQMRSFRGGPSEGAGPEVNDEEITRAMMAVRANTMSYEAASPDLTQMLVDLLNKGITPVVQSRGTPGEGDLPQMSNIGGAMVGAGDAYYRGTRMSAAQALAHAGLKPLKPFAADEAALTSTNAYSIGQTALLLYDTRRTLDWADMIYAMNLLGMNSSVTPIATPVQKLRPFRWLNWQAERMRDLLKGSYLYEADDKRIIQDPESLRASTQRHGAAWQAWAELKRDTLTQINSSDHNPAIAVGSRPKDAWDLNTPMLKRYYIKGGANAKYSKTPGYILSNANWDPYPIVNQIEALTNAIVNMDAAVGQRQQRFSNPFFTIVEPADVLTPEQSRNGPPRGADYTIADLTTELHTLATPVPAQGNPIVRNVEDLQAASRLKVSRARLAVDTTMELLGHDLMTASYWMDIRRVQDPKRSFGAAPTAALAAFRRVVPWQQAPDSRPNVPPSSFAYAFLQGTPASSFYPKANAEPRAAIKAAKSRTARATKRSKAKRRFLVTQTRER